MVINGKHMHEFNGTRVKIMVTSKCTTTCRHCCLNFVGSKSPDDVRRIVKDLQDKYEIRLDGSELLLDEEYIRIMREVGQDNVLTNSRIVLMDPERCIRILKENEIKDVYFSYHYGIQQELNDVPLSDVELAISIIKQAGFRVGIMSTVTKKNLYLLDEMCQKAVDLGAFFIQINPIVLQGNAKKFMQEDALTKEEMNIARIELERIHAKYSPELVVDVGKAFEITPGGQFYCRAVTKKVWVGIDNKVYPCIYLIEPGMEIGEYKDGKVWVEDSVIWGGKRCAAYLHCNEHIDLWRREAT